MKDISTNDKLYKDHRFYNAWSAVRVLLDQLESAEASNNETLAEEFKAQIRKYTVTFYKENGKYVAILDTDEILRMESEKYASLEEKYTKEFLEAYPIEELWYEEMDVAFVRDYTPYGSNF